jgi:hypothetical protein
LQFERHPALRIVGGSIEDPQQASTDHSDSDSTEATDSNAAFVRTDVTDAQTASQVGDGVKTKMKRPSLNIGLNSEAMEKIKTQSSRVLTSLGPAAMSFCQLLYQTNGMLTKPAVYALALLGSSFGFHLFLYFITIGYAFGVTLPVTVAMILYNVSQSDESNRRRHAVTALSITYHTLPLFKFPVQSCEQDPALDQYSIGPCRNMGHSIGMVLLVQRVCELASVA